METEVSALKNLLQCNAPSPDAKSRSLPHAYHHHKHKKSGLKKMIKKIKRKSGSSKHHTTTVGPVDLVKHKSEVVTGAALVEGEVRREGAGERGGEREGGRGRTVREREEKEKRREEGEGGGGEGRRKGEGWSRRPCLSHDCSLSRDSPTAYSRGL